MSGLLSHSEISVSLQNQEEQIIENAGSFGRQVLGNRNFLPRISVSGWEAFCDKLH